MSLRRTAMFMGFGVAILVVVSGCAHRSSAPIPTASNRPSTRAPSYLPVPTAAPTSVPEPPAPRLYAYGDILKQSEFLEFHENGSLLTTYGMQDGTVVLTDASRALPAVVNVDVQSRLDTIGQDESGGQQPGAAKFQAERALEFDVQNAGKNIVTMRLRYMAVPNADGTSGGYRWVATSNVAGWWMQWDRSRDALLGTVNAWVNANGTPNEWVVFVGPGDALSPSP